MIRYAYVSTVEPTSIDEEFADPNWKHTMDEEYSSLIKNKTWHLVPSHSGHIASGCIRLSTKQMELLTDIKQG